MLCLAALSFAPLSAIAQDKLALKSNLLYGAVSFTPNLGVEVGVGERTTLNVSGGYNWINLSGSAKSNKKLVHWIVQPEFRYFLNERFNGHYLGVHGIGSMYNIGGYELPLLLEKGSKHYRYEGSAYGGGFSYGYQLKIAKQWSIDFNVGLGYMYMKYDKYNCANCGKLQNQGVSKHYFGPTQAGISIMYMLN
jgi:hypothetical protein